MNTYFSKDLSKAKKWEKEAILSALLEDCKNGAWHSTIQWNCDTDSLYGVSSLEEIENPSDNGLIWHYEPTFSLLQEIKNQLNQ
jgi:hypothetical protein